MTKQERQELNQWFDNVMYIVGKSQIDEKDRIDLSYNLNEIRRRLQDKEVID